MESSYRYAIAFDDRQSIHGVLKDWDWKDGCAIEYLAKLYPESTTIQLTKIRNVSPNGARKARDRGYNYGSDRRLERVK
jgi:hypothetical protein